jgi:hypothetical protein
MKNIKHLILTPFNFNFFCPGVNPLTDEWMEKRLHIFMNVTYPSLMSQTVMDFEWIVGFDPKTPIKWREKINSLKGFLKIYPQKPSSRFWPDLIGTYYLRNYILTTRIDNDDAFANNAIEVIQSVVDNSQPRYINFLHGLVSDGKVTYLLDYESNSFISRLEKSSGAESVRTIDHTKAHNTKYFQQVDSMPPLWLIYIHDLNYGWKMETAKIGYLRNHSPAPKDVFNNFDINI